MHPNAAERFFEYFAATIRNPNTRAAYMTAVADFLAFAPVAGLGALAESDGSLELAQEMANHASPRTTKLYDRRDDKITQDAVERIRIE